MLGDIGLIAVKSGSDVADGALAVLQQLQDAQAVGLAEQTEPAGDGFQDFFVGEGAEGEFDVFGHGASFLFLTIQPYSHIVVKRKVKANTMTNKPPPTPKRTFPVFRRPRRFPAAASFALLTLCLAVSRPGCAQEAPATVSFTLQQAIQEALRKNPELQGATDASDAAAARVEQSRAEWYPRVDFSQEFTRGNNPVYVFGTLLTQRRFTADNFDLARLNTPTPLDNFQTRFDGRMLLFDSGQRRYLTQGAREAKTAADFQKEQARQDLILRVVRAYFGVMVAKEEEGASSEALRAAEANEQRAEHMQKAGLTVDSDLLSARVFTAQRKDREIRAKNGVELARLVLAREMGMAPGAAPDVSGSLEEPAAGSEKTAEDWEKSALERRPALQAARLAGDAATSARKSARAEFGPRLGVFADYERDGISFAGSGGTSWTAGARLDFNIFAGGAQKARLAEAQANESQAKHDLEWLQSGVLLEVRQACLEVSAAAQRAEAARGSADQAKESLRILQNRYEAGLTTITELLRAQSAQLDARTAYLSAVHDWRVAQAELERAAGMLTVDSPVLQGEKQP